MSAPHTDYAVNAADINAAALRIAPFITRTPTILCGAISERVQRSVYLKCESMQRTGSFKIRGASNAVQRIPASDAHRGVVTHSSGNHGLALAVAAANRNIPAHVVMPANASDAKRQAVRATGAQIITSGNSGAERESLCNEIAQRTGATIIPPFDHPWVIAGQGTLALEILEDLPTAATLVIPVGGGGMISGMAIAARALRPDIRIVGAEPELAGDAAESKRTGRRAAQHPPITIADGLRTALGELTYPIVRDFVDDIALVSEEEIISAMHFIFTQARLVIESSAAVGVAAILANRIGGDTTRPTVCVICGGNTDLSQLPWLHANRPRVS